MRWMMLIAVLGACAAEDREEAGKPAVPADVAFERCHAVGVAVCGRFDDCGEMELDGCLGYWDQTRCGVGNCRAAEYCFDPIALEQSQVDECVAFATALSCPDIKSGRWNLVNLPLCGS